MAHGKCVALECPLDDDVVCASPVLVHRTPVYECRLEQLQA